MKTCSPPTKRITHALSLCAALFAASLTAPEAGALDITGLITVNGAETPGVLVGAYDCQDGAFLGATHTGATDASSGTPLNYSISVPADNVRLELYYHPTPELVPLADWCREYVLCGQIILEDGKTNVIVNVAMTCKFSEPEKACALSPGYWKNHPDSWPVDEITIGGRTLTKLQAIALMKLPEKGDKTKNAFRNLVAAKLNVMAGTDDSCIAKGIDTADAWLTAHPVCSRVKASSAAWKSISSEIARLDAYNNGELCAPSCHDDDDDGDVKK
jgi:hypothetical protein